MATLTSHSNVYNTCLRLLRRKGWSLRLEGDDEADLLACSWCAELDGYRLVADNPLELLGLVSVYEAKAPQGAAEPYWWTVEGEDIVDELASRRWPD